MKVRDVIGEDARVTTSGRSDFKPDITIITPTYCRNAEGLLRRCLESARAQTFTNYEHIIIDDGSSDGTEELVLELCKEDERIVYVRHDRNSGLPAVRTNEGILRARGRAVAFLFDDNTFKPDFLAEALKLLDASGADVVHGEVDIPVVNGNAFVLGGWPLTLDLLRTLNTIANGGVLIRTDFFERYGLYDPHLAARRLCDWELWVRSLWLGARFRHLPRAVAEEGGLVSQNSLGNTVATDWKAVYGYLQDTSAYADRAQRFRPSTILHEDVLDASAVRRYVRDEREWQVVVDQIYRPYLDRQGIDFDPMLQTNRAWHPTLALHARRFRMLFLANALPSLVMAMMEAVRTIPGAIVVNCPDWQFSTFEPGSLDLIFIVDGANPNTTGLLDAHRQRGARLVYLSLYGEQNGAAPFDLPDYSQNPHLIKIFGDTPPYMPQSGYGHSDWHFATASALREIADITVTSGVPRSEREIRLPSLTLPTLASPTEGARRIAYRLRRGSRGASEAIARRKGARTGRDSSESLASLVISRPGTEIAIDRNDLHLLPLADLIGLGCLAVRHGVSIIAAHGAAADAKDAATRLMSAAQWEAWFANLARMIRLQQRLLLQPRRRLIIDIYLMSELFSGSEAYGLGLAKSLHELGVDVRVRVPRVPVYDGEHIALNDWLGAHGVPLATRAPFIQGTAWLTRSPQERAATLSALSSFVAADPPDLILSSGYIPHLAYLPGRPPLFMALFSPAAYDQRELAALRGRVDGLMSDSAWALGPSTALIGTPGRVIRSSVFGVGGNEVDRVLGRSRALPIRIAVAGTLQRRKRQLEAVKAVGILLRQGYDVELNLYGYALEALRDYIDEIDAAIKQDGLEDRVRRHGFVEDDSEIAKNNEIVLSASTDESLPQGLLFQMYEGLIGVAVLCGGIDEVVVDGETGYLTDDPAPLSIARVLAKAIDDRDRWPSIVREARHHIYERCGAGNVTANLLDLFEEGLALHQQSSRELQGSSLPLEQSRPNVAFQTETTVARRLPAQPEQHPAFGGATRVRDVIGEDARVTISGRSDFKPEITIITPTYRRNAEGLLRRCLESARAQTFTNYEHIIIDDGSSDGTEELVLELCKEDERIVYVRHDRNSGLPAVRTNEGILRARGRAVAFLFDDNVFMPDFLAEALKLLDASGADVVHGQVSMPFPGGTTYVIGGSPVTLDLLRGVNTIANGGVLIRRNFFDRFGLYDPHLVARRLCDWELWMRALWLGARFQHLPQVVAEEGGVVSPTSLANTVAIDWKAVYGYLQDTSTYTERASRFSPSRVLDEDVLDPVSVRGYVRDETEWQKVVDQIYRPFLERQGLEYDAALYSNRMASIDPMHGWNPDWALHRKRFRVLFLANAVPSFVAAMIDGVRAIPGAIVINCPEWHFSAFEPGSVDIIFVVDGTLSSLGSVLDAHREAGARVAYLSLYGDQDGTPPFGLRDHAVDPYLFSIFGGVLPYFPQTGIGHRGQQVETGQAARNASDVVIGTRSGHGGEIVLPPLPVASLPSATSTARTIAYRLPPESDVLSADEVIAREQGASLPGSSQSLVSLVISRPGAEIVIDAADLAALPRADVIGLGCLAEKHGVSLVTSGNRQHAHSAITRAMFASQWNGWFGNVARLLRLQKLLNLPSHTQLTVDFYLNSELYSGSEAYGLGLAKCLHELGVEVRIRIPQAPVYGGEHIAINDWLKKENLPLATRAPFIQGPVWSWRSKEEQVATLKTLASYVEQDPPDLIIASSYMPHLAHLRRRPSLFMALFSPAPYKQSETIKLQGRVDGILSDSAWALRPWSTLIGARGQVIRSAVFGVGGNEIDRVLGRPRDLPIRIAVAGTLQRRKRQLEAVKAVGILIREGYDVELNLYGYALDALKDYVDQIDDTIKQAGLESRVRRHGFVEDGSEITKNNEIVLSASTDESLPQGLLFQMYEGLIGVAVLCGGIDEIVVDGETGYLTDDPAPLSIARALARAIDDRDSWPEIAQQARHAVFEECGMGRTTARLLDLLAEGVALRAPSDAETEIVAPVPPKQPPAAIEATPATTAAADAPMPAQVVFLASPVSAPSVQESPPATALDIAPAPQSVVPPGMDAANPGKRVRLTFKAPAGRVGGVDIQAEEGSQISGVLYSAIRSDLPLRRAQGKADASGIVRLRWPWTENCSKHTFILELEVRPAAGGSGRRPLLSLLRGRRIRLKDVLCDDEKPAVPA